MHLKKFQIKKVKIVGGDSYTNHSAMFRVPPHFTFYIFFKPSEIIKNNDKDIENIVNWPALQSETLENVLWG